MRKNLAKLNNKPLIQYTYDLVSLGLKVDDVMLSTDNEEIISHSNKYNFSKGYIRPKYLSTDTASIVDTILHGVKWYQRKFSVKVDAILLLQPTSPIRNIEEINLALNKFKKNNSDSMFSVIQNSQIINETIELNNLQNSNKWKFLNKNLPINPRRQNYKEKFFYIDGSFYICKISFIKKYNCLIKENLSEPYKIQSNFQVDIDEKEDLMLANAILKYKIIEQ